MTTVTNDLMFETLKTIQGDLTDLKADTGILKEGMNRIDMRLKVVEAHMTGFSRP